MEFYSLKLNLLFLLSCKITPDHNFDNFFLLNVLSNNAFSA